MSAAGGGGGGGRGSARDLTRTAPPGNLARALAKAKAWREAQPSAREEPARMLDHPLPNIKQPQPHAEEMTDEKLAALPPELLIKHPLHNSWTLWYFENDKSKTWEQNQVEIITVQTVEDFWSTYNYIETASNLKHGTDYSLFKQGIRPMWEDKRNRNGGRWLISLDRGQKQRLDIYWLDVMLLMIGERFGEAGETVCGAVVNIRNKGDKIAVWTGDAKRADDCVKVGQRIKEELNISPKMLIGYQAHSDTMVKSGSVAKNKYTV